MTETMNHADTGLKAAGKARSAGSLGAVGLALGLVLSGCGFFEESRAVTYEVETVSGDPGAENLLVEYLGRESGMSSQETVGSTVTDGSGSAQFETLGRVDDEVSVSVSGVPGAVLRCAVIIDDSETLVEAESSASGESVECSATVPAQEGQG
ncbi:hypothetical protein [Nesterenkonia sp. NBAIMH1]|uniref:hypothetical protein n=1 Tax=Nesterenkonia sp. NBAIMH1 TaxID=2600320 RepID=UPI0011B6EB13|nr:hypothetical protein [Nesterenkonia sp. NBAIMH1]